MGAILIAVASPHIISDASKTTIIEHSQLMLGVQQPRQVANILPPTYLRPPPIFIATVFEGMGV